MKVLMVLWGLLETALSQRILRCLTACLLLFNDYADDLNYIAVVSDGWQPFQASHCFKQGEANAKTN